MIERRHLQRIPWLLSLALVAIVSAKSKNEVVTLDQFTVEARRINPHPWRIVAVPGYEILSQCDENQTEAVARHVANSLELARRMMPSGSWGEQTVPLTLILFDFKPTDSIAPFVPKSLEPTDAAGSFGAVVVDGVKFDIGNGGEGRTGGVDVRDSDTYCVVQNRWKAPWNWSGGATGRGPIPLGLLSRLNNVEPPMPAWFKYGLVGPCGLLRIRTVRSPESQAYRGMLVAGARWLTDSNTATLVSSYKERHSLPILPPIGELFQVERGSKLSPPGEWPSPELMAEAALFVRWGMTPVADEAGASRHGARLLNSAHENAFARFLEQSRHKPITEAVFVECFGFGYGEMQSILARYLVTIGQEPFVLSSHITRGWSPDDPVPPLRAATADEIGRIIGDWLRMQAGSLSENRLVERDAYLRAAGRVLEHAYRDDNDLSPSVGLLPPKDIEQRSRETMADTKSLEKAAIIAPGNIRDPRLLAVYGLYYFDLGDAASARVLLEATVQAKIPRPAAYIALANLNRAAALAKPAGKNGKFSDRQVSAILAPLRTVIDNWKLDAEGYLLAAQTWSHAEAKPSLADLHVLVDGMRRYPFDSALLCATAELYAQWQYWREADDLIARRLQFVDAATADTLRAAQVKWSDKR